MEYRKLQIMFKPEFYFNKYVCVYHNDILLASGKVVDYKIEGKKCISVDRKWFFNDTENISVNIVDFVETKEFNPEENIISWAYWRDVKNKPNEDVYREFCYDEIDTEIKSYIDRLNQINDSIKTVSSCCGHGSGKWYVTFIFSDYEALHNFIKIVETHAKNIMLKNTVREDSINNQIMLKLVNLTKDKDFKILDKFVTNLETFFRIKY